MAVATRDDVEAVILDLDDTLISTRAAMHAAGAAAIRALWPGVGEEAALDGGVRFRDDPGGHFAAFTRGELDFAEMRAARIRDLADWLGVAVPDGGQRSDFEAAYEPAFGAGLRAFDDVVPAVSALVSTGVAVGVLTNSSGVYTERKLETVGLAGLVDVVVTRDTLGYGKPDPRVFEHTCRLLGATPGRTVHVGDEFAVDVVGAVGAGIDAIWIRREGYPVEAEELSAARAQGIRLVDGLTDLPLWVGGRAPTGADLGSSPADR